MRPLALVAAVGLAAFIYFVLWQDGGETGALPVPNSETAHTQESNTDVLRIPQSRNENNDTNRYTNDDGIAVLFRNGQTVDIKITQPPKYPEIPEGRIADLYDQLSSNAESGDSEAAFILHNLLANCAASYKSVNELNEAINQLYQTHSVQSPNDSKLTPVVGSNDDRLKIVEDSLRKTYHRCAGLADAHISNPEHWLQLAADFGDAHAARRLGQQLIGTDPSEAEKYLEVAWMAGDLGALSELAYIHSKARLNESDPILANAYWELYTRIFARLQTAGRKALTIPPSEDFSRELSFMLRPRDQNQVDVVAMEILRSSSNCCFSREFK